MDAPDQHADLSDNYSLVIPAKYQRYGKKPGREQITVRFMSRGDRLVIAGLIGYGVGAVAVLTLCALVVAFNANRIATDYAATLIEMPSCPETAPATPPPAVQVPQP